jgi:hypothetical protein
MYEQYGKNVMQVILATTNYLVYKGKNVSAVDIVDSLLPWLTEQHDRDERRETWLITMEVSITILVLGEVMLALFPRLHF